MMFYSASDEDPRRLFVIDDELSPFQTHWSMIPLPREEIKNYILKHTFFFEKKWENKQKINKKTLSRKKEREKGFSRFIYEVNWTIAYISDGQEKQNILHNSLTSKLTV